MIFPGVLSFFQVFQVKWEPCLLPEVVFMAEPGDRAITGDDGDVDHRADMEFHFDMGWTRVKLVLLSTLSHWICILVSERGENASFWLKQFT